MKAYPKYKPSGVEWIGEIPEKWELTRMKYVAPLQGGYAFKTEAFKTEGIAIVKMNNLKRGRLDLSDAVRVDFKAAVDAFSLKAGDLLFGMSGSLGETGSLGNFAVVNLVDIPCQLNQRVGRFVALQNCSLDFVRFLITSVSFTEPIMSSSTGTAQFNISSEQIGNILISLPPLPEQTAIADFLDRKTAQIDGFIAKKQKLIELLREERVAVINHAVTKGIDPKAKMKPSGIDWLGEIPAHWEVKRLKFFANVNPTKCNYVFDKSSNELVVFLPMENVLEDGQIIQDLRKPINELSTGYTYFEKNDVIVAKITPCFENGKGALLDRLETPFGFGSTEFHTIRPVKAVSTNEFLYFLTKTDLFMKFGEAFMVGAAGQKRVPPNFVENFMIASPSLDEQNHIVAFLKSETAKIDRTIATIEKEIELIQEYRTALISEAVTGKIDVRG
ncbi:MAG TPA: restriction endonuclease subunit S [bacterium]|nr:restriction endonuclease subunit S [bacterium]HMW35235.1 restriction endonuclease subunit S [bacterium]HMZ03534.1 restriction endonuclease subunit S [bacterium]HNB08089.1 restriction endonuclease subunit S [bacterium]HND76502.1 restriction endonuclease subunit S [bacterium]